jgi:glycosidase
MDQILEYWQKTGVDGFRCDMAHLIPKEAWSYLIRRARQPTRDPNGYFLAEAYVGIGSHDPIKTVSELLDAGFDSVNHDKSYNGLRGIYAGAGSQDAYDAEMGSLSVRERGAAVDYLENHDKPRVAASIAAGGGLASSQWRWNGGVPAGREIRARFATTVAPQTGLSAGFPAGHIRNAKTFCR